VALQPDTAFPLNSALVSRDMATLGRRPQPHRGARIPLAPGPARTRVLGPLTHSSGLAYPWPRGFGGGVGVADNRVRKANRLRRLWPARTAALPPAPRSLAPFQPLEPLPPRSLTARELIAMARQARARSNAGDPPRSTDVS
jgi:hypothetical protein